LRREIGFEHLLEEEERLGEVLWPSSSEVDVVASGWSIWPASYSDKVKVFSLSSSHSLNLSPFSVRACSFDQEWSLGTIPTWIDCLDQWE
jgi:hypothetical protein